MPPESSLTVPSPDRRNVPAGRDRVTSVVSEPCGRSWFGVPWASQRSGPEDPVAGVPHVMSPFASIPFVNLPEEQFSPAFAAVKQAQVFGTAVWYGAWLAAQPCGSW